MDKKSIFISFCVAIGFPGIYKGVEILYPEIPKFYGWLSLILGIFFGLVIPIFVFINNRFKNKKKVKAENKFDKSLEELNLDNLKEWVNHWTELYQGFINRVVLYRYPLLSDKKYCLYFEFEVFSETGSKMKKYFNSYEWDEEHYPIRKNEIEKFKNVYKQSPQNNNYINGWEFVTDKPRNSNKLESIVIYNKSKSK